MSGWKNWASGELVTEPDFQSLLQDQTVMRFASAAARDAQLQVPVEGMMCTLADTDEVYRYDGTAWRELTQARGNAVAGTMNPAWSGFCQARLVGGLLVYAGSATAGTAVASTWYDFATMPAAVRPAGTLATGVCYVQGVAGLVEIQTGGLVRVYTGPKHTSGSTDVRFLLPIPLR